MRLIDDHDTERDFFFEVSKYSAFLWKSHLERHLALYELYKTTAHLPGSVAEFGVFNGSTFFFLARLIEIFNAPHFEKYQASSHHLYGFDTFEGIVRLHEQDTSSAHTRQRAVGGFAQHRDVFFRDLDAFKRDSTIAERVHVIAGDACETFPAFVRDNPGVRFRFVLMDFDIYEPTRVVLDSIFPLMVPGGVIAFDEYAFPEWPGETKAVDAFVRKHGLTLRGVPHTFAPSAYTVIG